ncbi:MAG: PAS domain-containing protein [Rhodobacteraceae bacterium]|nr:MAG: PAS domain-containing protein [Paracoccaceae bacterium]
MERMVSPPPGDLSEEDAISLFASSRVAMVLTNPRLDDNPIVYVNRAFQKVTGYASEIAVGQNCRFLQGEGTEKEHIDALRDAVRKAEDIGLTLTNYRADGSEFRNSLLITPILDAETEEPVFFLGLQRDVSRDREAEVRAHVDDLITEIQHRVKNHLSMIVGLIRMQARTSERPEEFNDISRRVESLQLLYEEMTAARVRSNEDRIQLGSYLGRVAAAIAHIDGRPGVRMNVDVAPLEVETDTAVRIGLIVSEILTNAMQHAFIDQRSGLVELRVTATDEGGVRATITDDGVGLPDGQCWPSETSLGGRIIAGLCEGLNATLDASSGAVGMVFTLEVPKARD